MEYIKKYIKGYEGLYKIDNLGNVFSMNFKNWGYEKQLKPSPDNNGYLMVSLFKDEKPTKIRVHRLIGLNFIPNPNNYPFINHIDGNKQNNKIENLEWCNCAMNNKHARENGLTNIKGSDHGRSKLTEKEVIEIRRIKKDLGLSNSELALKFNVKSSNISIIINRKSWKHI